MRRYAPFIIVSAVALLAMDAGILLYNKYRPAPQVTLRADQHDASQNSAVHARGTPNARVTVEEFGDFQCPPCGMISEPLNQLERQYEKNMRLIFREYPLTMTHQNAMAAACAAEAAGLQKRFWEMHDVLYREQANWSKATAPRELFVGYAKIVGLDVARFEKDIDSQVVKDRVSADQKRANELGVKVTPTIFVNGKSVPTARLNPNGLHAAVDEVLKATPAETK